MSDIEYVLLRVARRFLFRDAFLLRCGRWVPYYRPNCNQIDPGPLVEEYARHLEGAGAAIRPGQTVLEIGVGATNSTGYEYAARFAPRRMLLLEPFVPFAPAADGALLKRVAARHGRTDAELSSAVHRLNSLEAVAGGTVDLILSSSVLEHVGDPPVLFRDLHRVLAPSGAMLHLVDYRDHFFKYPYHFLRFSRRTWDRFLDPGDLPRWRLYDHLEQLAAAGFDAQVLAQQSDPVAFGRVARRLAPDFRRHDPRLAVTFAAIWAVPKP
jgi:SAM-dependent methyltransferase